MPKPLRIAIAGAGMVTRHHLIGWRRLADIEIVGICNRTRARADERAREFAIPRVFQDFEAMLDELRPDAVDIASATETHAPRCRAAAERKIHILCQKPLTDTLAEAEELIADVGERVRFMVHENWRFRPQYRIIGEWVRQGRIGPIREFCFATRSSGFLTRGPNRRPFALERQPFLSGMRRLLILEVLVHHLDTLRYLAGPLRVAAARAARVSPDLIGEDVAQIVLDADSGAFGTVVGNLSAPGYPPLPSDRLELVGATASVLFENNVVTLNGATQDRVELDLGAAYQASYDNAIAHFVTALRSDKPFETDRLDNIETLRLVDRAYSLAMRP